MAVVVSGGIHMTRINDHQFWNERWMFWWELQTKKKNSKYFIFSIFCRHVWCISNREKCVDKVIRKPLIAVEKCESLIVVVLKWHWMEEIEISLDHGTMPSPNKRQQVPSEQHNTHTHKCVATKRNKWQAVWCWDNVCGAAHNTQHTLKKNECGSNSTLPLSYDTFINTCLGRSRQ